MDELVLDAQWRARLEARLSETPAVGRADAIALIRQELFTPLIGTTTLRDHSDALVGELIDALPELIVAAGDPYGALDALRATVGADSPGSNDSSPMSTPPSARPVTALWLPPTSLGSSTG